MFLNILEGKKNILLCLIVREAYKENIKKNVILELIFLKGLTLKCSR